MRHSSFVGAFAAAVFAFGCSSTDTAGGGGATSSTATTSGGAGGASSTSASAGGGGGGSMSDAAYRSKAVSDMHSVLLKDIDALLTAAKAIEAAAPTPSGRGWDPSLDASAIAAMKSAWIDARHAYEGSEGAIAPLFPDIDAEIDARYDDFLSTLGAAGDQDLFDGKGVTGMHAIERILYSDVTPQRVIDFESTLPGYKASAFPATETEAQEFKTGLSAQLVADIEDLKSQWVPANINPAISYQGLISLMNEQREKVEKASSDEEESRYSQRTMVDLRDNLAGTKVVYALFQPWILSKKDAKDASKDGPRIDATIQSGFASLATAYAMVSSAEIPLPPATWSAESPSSKDLKTPFGVLYTEVLGAVDPTKPQSVVSQMNDAAATLGFPEFGP